jgi:hypothetical protein
VSAVFSHRELVAIWRVLLSARASLNLTTYAETVAHRDLLRDAVTDFEKTLLERTHPVDDDAREHDAAMAEASDINRARGVALIIARRARGRD